MTGQQAAVFPWFLFSALQGQRSMSRSERFYLKQTLCPFPKHRSGVSGTGANTGRLGAEPRLAAGGRGGSLRAGSALYKVGREANPGHREALGGAEGTAGTCRRDARTAVRGSGTTVSAHPDGSLPEGPGTRRLATRTQLSSGSAPSLHHRAGHRAGSQSRRPRRPRRPHRPHRPPVPTCSLLSSTASVVLLPPGLAAFQNCFCAE